VSPIRSYRGITGRRGSFLTETARHAKGSAVGVQAGNYSMQFDVARPDVVRAIHQRWLLKFWQRHLGDHRVPRWQAIEAEDLSHLADNLSFIDVMGERNSLRFQIRFHGRGVGEVFGMADCRGKFLYAGQPEPARSQKLAPYRHAVARGRPVYTIHDIVDRDGRPVQYERLLLPFSSDGNTVDRILTSFEFICEDGTFVRRELMSEPAGLPSLRLSATIEPHATS
jgi:hypothetical protein